MMDIYRHRFIPVLSVWIFVAHLVSGCQSADWDEVDYGEESEEGISFKLDLDRVQNLNQPTCPSFPGISIEATGKDVINPLSQPEPEPRLPFTDPAFNTCLIRVTDRTSDLSPYDPSPGIKNEYSRVQSFNADDSLILARGIEGTWYVYDAQTLLPYGEAPLDVEPRWDDEDPFTIYFFEDTSLYSYHLKEGERRNLHDFSSDFPEYSISVAWTRYEGSPSADRSLFGVMVQDQDWEVVGFGIYDLNADQLRARRLFPDGVEVDSVTISPSGKYFLAFFDTYCERGQLGTDQDPCGFMVYDQDLGNGRGLLRIVGHADIAFGERGKEVLVYQDIDTDFISMVDLASG